MVETKDMTPVVVGCTGGSGSRVLRNILAATPEIFMDQNCSDNARDSQASKAFLEHMEESKASDRIQLVHNFMNDILAQIPSGDTVRYQYFGWKNPRNLAIIDDLLTVHPGLRFLHLIRNPAAMVNSSHPRKRYKQQRAKGNATALAGRSPFILNGWVSQNLPVWEKYKDNPRYLLVHYEELIESSRQTIQNIYNWLNIKTEINPNILSAISPPADAISRSAGVDISSIADAARELGYGYQLAE